MNRFIRYVYVLCMLPLICMSGCVFSIDDFFQLGELHTGHYYVGSLHPWTGYMQIDIEGHVHTGKVRFDRQPDGDLIGTLQPTDAGTLTCQLKYTAQSGGLGQCSDRSGKEYQVTFWHRKGIRM